MIELLAQIPQPNTALSGDWAVYIISGLVMAVVSLALFVKFIFKSIKDALTLAWTDVRNMHNDAMDTLKKTNERGIKNESTLSEIKTDLKEAKYSIQTLSRSIKCRERETHEA